MAYSLETIRNSIKTSIYGRRFGLIQAVATDVNSEHVGGHNGSIVPVTDATSDTTGTNITGYGVTTVDTSTDDTWLLSAPVRGAFKHIFTGPTTSTGIRTIKRADATFAINSSASSTGTTIVAQAGNLMLTLFGLTSTAYVVVGRPTGMSSACSTEMAINGTT